MAQREENQILARTSAASFIGRDADFERLGSHARSSGGLALLAAPFVGASELLRQTFDRVFTGQGEIVPFYFELRAEEDSARDVALRFLREFLLQTVAFRRRDARIIDASPEICEIAELAPASDAPWIDRLVDSCLSGGKLNDERFFIRNCLSAPLRAAGHGVRPFVMIDGLHNVADIRDGSELFDDINDIFSRTSIPFVLAGHRRFLFAKTAHQSMPLEPLAFSDAGRLIENLSEKTALKINDQTRDLMAVQLGGSPGYLRAIFADAEGDLDTFERVERAYTESIFGGRIARHFDKIFNQIFPDAETQFNAVRMMHIIQRARNGKIPASYWKKKSGLSGEEFSKGIARLHWYESVNYDSGMIAASADQVTADYIRARARLEIDGVQRALAVGDAFAENTKQAPQMMARFYRRNSALGLRELMSGFDGRLISRALIDYSRFADEFKGADDDKIRKALKEDNEKFALPRIVFTANTAAFYPKLDDLCDTERSAIAVGFEETAENDETVWIAAEIDSKLEAKRDVAEFWCDRLEMAALNSNFPRYKLWLIAPEGFAPDAREVLVARGAFGSSRKQAELLAEMLGVEKQKSIAETSNEYEIVVPMGDDTEMIGALALDEIGRRNDIPTKTINQIKTALVEACINAAEHGLSPDRKIYQKFKLAEDRITVAVTNRGVRLTDKITTEVPEEEGRRGWGLKLIKGLMDEVTLDKTDDGTRITMVKYLRPINIGKDD